VKRLRLVVIPEASTRLAALRSGQISLVDAVPPLDAGVLAREPALKVVSGPQKLNCRLYLNGRPKDKFDSGGKDGLYGDTRTRLALAQAVRAGGSPSSPAWPSCSSSSASTSWATGCAMCSTRAWSAVCESG